MTTDPAKSIPAFYAGQNIFLTGSTGFLGKVFIEKVLRSCPDVREIFLFMRPKKGLSIDERLEKILNLPLYEKLRKEQPTNFKKLIPICGDASKKDLGLSVADRQMLIERVTIIIHASGEVKFNSSLKYAIFVNTRATKDICTLAQSIKNLIALIYVSTAFTHVNEPILEEKVYPPVADWQKMIEMAESLDEHTLNVFTAKYLDYAPNTYIFSKNLAESIIQEYSSSLPCLIVRPSMVFPSEKEPMPGWIDNVYGPIGLLIGGGKGIIRIGCMNKTVNQDVVPVDVVIKAIIVAAWKIGLTTFTTDPTFFVLNCTSQKYMTCHDYIKLCQNVGNDIPFEGIVWTPGVIFTDNSILFYILTILLHILPAMLIDLILKFSGRRAMVVRLMRKLYVANRAISYFSFHEWKYSHANRLSLISSIPPDNLNTFSFDYSDVDLKTYVTNNIIGGKKYLLHEDMNRLDAARAHARRVYLIGVMVKAVISVGALWIMYKWIFFDTF